MQSRRIKCSDKNRPPMNEMEMSCIDTQVNILQNSRGPPPLAKNQPVGKNWLKNHKNQQNSHQKSCFKPIFIIIFPLFCQIIQNLAFLLQIVQKCGNLVRKFPKISLAKNERRCRGPWQKIDFLVKYSPVTKCYQMLPNVTKCYQMLITCLIVLVIFCIYNPPK